jgi:two-component system phosphate regulon sensor histidine kinase PhoR
MRSSVTRLLILSFSLLIVILTGIQLYWINKTYSFEQHEFHVSVIKSIRGIYEDINMVEDPAGRLDKLIEHPNADTYIFRADQLPQGDTLAAYMKDEFDAFDVYTECNIGVYDHTKKAYTYRNRLLFTAPVESKKNELPALERSFNYVCLYFPNRNLYVLSRMNNWIITSIVIMLLLAVLSFSLYYFFREKFMNEVQKDFINNVTHEFSTPLAIIDLATDAIERSAETADTRRIKKHSSSIRYQTEYLKKHIQALMRTLVAENSPFDEKKVPVNVNLLIRRAVAQLEPLIAEKNGNVTLDLEPENMQVPANQDSLYLALFNIVSNALKYAEYPRVYIRTYAKNHNYYIMVRDNGIGIERKDMKYIFRKFYRGQENYVRPVKGLGLGLYFTKKVIRMHRGDVDVTSMPGEGSTFTVNLPVGS